MQKSSAFEKSASAIHRRRSTSSRCMIAICPAGPPNPMHPSFNQNLTASRKEGLASSGMGTTPRRQ